MTEIDFALSQQQDTDRIELVGTVLWNKASQINDFSELSIYEQTFIYIDIFEGELTHGGVFDFFYNSSGAYAHQVLHAYETIGANETANLFSELLKTFPELPVPKDILIRRSVMNQLQNSDITKWDTIEQSFLNSKEDIVALLLDYIETHKTFFEY